MIMLNKTKLFVLAAAIMLGGLTVANAQVNPQSEIKDKRAFLVCGERKNF